MPSGSKKRTPSKWSETGFVRDLWEPCIGRIRGKMALPCKGQLISFGSRYRHFRHRPSTLQTSAYVGILLVKAFNPPQFIEKKRLFDPPTGPLRLEVNARQRDAPSGAYWFE